MAGTPSVIGRYRVIRRLGGGGMGVVYLAHDPVIDRQVAVKVLRASLDDDDLRERFLREARSAGRLSHPNIVTIFDTADYQGQPFIAMAYIAGETLSTVIEQRQAMRLSRKLELLDGLCAGLGYAHANGVIHRDIKPNNLIIDPNGDVKILDFGVARLAQASQTGVTIVGTPSFMSPEQINGARIDHRSDIFAVGLVLYELVSYRRAFSGETSQRVFHQILSEQPPLISTLCPGIDAAMDGVVTRALQKDPDARYQTLATFREELAAIRNRVRGDNTLDLICDFEAGGARTLVLPKKAQRTPRILDPKLLEARRRQRIQELLAVARQAFEDGRLDDTVEHCEQALLMDPVNADVLELAHMARAAVEQRQCDGWLDEARTQMGSGALTSAERLIGQALSLVPDQQTARQLQRELIALRKEREKAAEQAQEVKDALDRGRDHFMAKRYAEALFESECALSLDPGSSEARVLQAEAQQRMEEEAEHRRQIEADERHRLEQRRLQDKVQLVLKTSMQAFDEGDLDKAARWAEYALTLDPSSSAAIEIRDRVQAAIDESSDEQFDEPPAVYERDERVDDSPIEIVAAGNRWSDEERPASEIAQPPTLVDRPWLEATLIDPPMDPPSAVEPTAPSPPSPETYTPLPVAAVQPPRPREPQTSPYDIPVPAERQGASQRTILGIAAAAVLAVAVVAGLWVSNGSPEPPPGGVPDAPPSIAKPAPPPSPPQVDTVRRASLLNDAKADEAANREEEALQKFRNVLELDATNVEARDGVERVQKTLERRQQVKTLLAEVAALLRRGDLAEARRRLTNVQQLDPGNAEAKTLLTRIADLAEERKKAERVGELVKEADALRITLKLFDEAIQKYKEALAIDPSSRDAMNGLKQATEEKILGGGKPRQ